ncbi:MAG: TetR/AcrR family transcriptional regulator [Thermodesulfobacteriota bacterium]
MKQSTAHSRQSASFLRREREKQLRRQTILQAAETLFARNGYRKTKIEDIADRAEVSVGTVYGYFQNKEELLVAVLDDIGLFIRQVAGKAFTEAGSTLEGIEKAGLAFFEELCRSHPDKALLLYDEAIGVSDQFISARRNFLLKMTADVQHALLQVKDGLGLKFASGLSAEVVSVCTTAIFTWLGMYYKIWRRRPEEITNIGRETVTYIVGGIRSLITVKESGS